MHESRKKKTRRVQANDCFVEKILYKFIRITLLKILLSRWDLESCSRPFIAI